MARKKRTAKADGMEIQVTPANGNTITQPEQPGAGCDLYRFISSCPQMGFELGENRGFKQRVFRFTQKPTAGILSELKKHGFTVCAASKSWTIPADPARIRRRTNPRVSEHAIAHNPNPTAAVFLSLEAPHNSSDNWNPFRQRIEFARQR